MLFGVVLFVVFIAGRKTFGVAVDWIFPPNTRIEGLLRWVAMLQLFIALAAGLGGEVLAMYAHRLKALKTRSWGAVVCVCVPLLILGLPRHVDDVRWGLGTFFEELDPAAFRATAEALALEQDPGRLHTSKETGHDNHWAMASLSLLADKPMTISIGVGVQDSLNLYYLSLFSILDRERAQSLARLFNVRYVLYDPKLDLSFLNPELVLRRGNYKTVRLRGEYGYFELVGEPEVVEAGAPVEHRKLFKRWLRQGYPKGAKFLRLPDPIQSRGISLPKSNLAHEDAGMGELGSVERPFTIDRRRRGTLSDERVELDGYGTHADVWNDDVWLLLKVTPHPYWRAEVDGEPAPLYTLSPAFMGLAIDPGEHDVRFTFRAPAWQKFLLLTAPLILLMLFLFDSEALHRRLRRAPRR
jgi:hypothetical protein